MFWSWKSLLSFKIFTIPTLSLLLFRRHNTQDGMLSFGNQIFHWKTVKRSLTSHSFEALYLLTPQMVITATVATEKAREKWSFWLDTNSTAAKSCIFQLSWNITGGTWGTGEMDLERRFHRTKDRLQSHSLFCAEGLKRKPWPPVLSAYCS